MKKILLSAIGMFIVGSISAQVVFSVEEPASIQGAYDLTFTEPSGGWGGPDMLDPANAIQDTLVQLLDISATEDSLGCLTAANAAAIDGNIAILYRGACEFGTKALNAENAGAIACVIINNTPGAPVGMAPGTDGANVTIPVVMVSLTTGQILLDEMQNNDVEVFIGNKTGFYPNDLGTTAGAVLRAKSASTPALIAQNDSEFEVEMGAMVYNYGFENQTNVTLSATIDFGGSNVYSEISSAEDISSGDSLFFTLPTFSQTTYSNGKYEVTYSISSDSVDSYDFDNTLSADFQINDSLYTYASIVDSSGAPNSSGGSRSSAATTTFSSCVAFQNENASRVAPTGMTFSAVKGANAAIPSLEGEAITIAAYRWEDSFLDINDPNIGFTSIPEIVFSEFIYPSDLAGIPVTAYFEQPFAIEDNQRYLFCVQTFSTDVFIGYDPVMDYTRNIDTYLQPLFPVESNGTFAYLGFGAENVPGVGVNFIDAALLNTQEAQLDIEMNAYPSPASDVLNITFNGYDVDQLELVNLTGQVVASQAVQMGAEFASVDVNNLENGVYIVNVYLSNGLTKAMQVVVNH